MSGQADGRADGQMDGADCRLAVYGSLAPGEVNQHQLTGLRGSWRDGTVRGDRHPVGWGATLGFPALHWRPDGPVVPVKLFESPDLPAHWARLDRFEGDAYRRIIVPVLVAGRELEANIYVAAGLTPCPPLRNAERGHESS